jgi:hypothetical protein
MHPDNLTVERRLIGDVDRIRLEFKDRESAIV